MVEIVSPMPGTFYSKPNPDADPFVQIGSEVSEDSIVCLVEVMKTFNEIKAQAKGCITKIHVENESFVNPGDVLFTIERYTFD